MKKNLIVFLVISFFSCQKKEANKTDEVCSKDSVKEKKFEMYEMSEMASLMEQMYAHNQQLRARIMEGDTIGEFPKYFNNIHTATLTTASDKDAFFSENAIKFIAAQKVVYTETENVKENFNKSVDACVTCHLNKCGGPIPRIKKLYIK
jgi:hypothetical protein